MIPPSIHTQLHYARELAQFSALAVTQSINFEKVALDLLQNESGKITPYGVIYDEGFELEQLYAGRQFPQYQFEDLVMELEITTTEDMDNDISPTCFYLPMSEVQLERALQRKRYGEIPCGGTPCRTYHSLGVEKSGRGTWQV